MSTPVYLKSSSVASKVPTTSTLALRELGVNTADGTLYLRQGTGVAGDIIIPVNPWDVSTGGTTIYNTYFTVGNVGIGTTNPSSTLDVSGKIQIQQDANSNNRLILRGTSGSTYRWNIDNYQSGNTFRIFREDDGTAANEFVAVSISTGGTVTANSFVGNGSGLTGIVATGSGVAIQNQGSSIGTASTINFSTNLTATLSSGVATITATGGGGSATYGGYQPVDLLEAMLFV